MKCDKFKDCKNAIYPNKCKTCGDKKLNYVSKDEGKEKEKQN